MLISFIISVGVMCGITGVLALLMVIADATIGNYGEVKISINDGEKELTVDGGRPLLQTLKDEEIFIPSACGGRGSCGLCKLKILEGAGEPLATETPWLTPDEIKAKVRLSCQVKVKTDVRIEIPEEYLSVKQYLTEVESIVDLTHDIKQVRLKLLEPDDIDYVAGAFVQIEVPEYELTDEPVYRAYSISSAPHEKGVVELEVRYVPNGICTTYVHSHLKVGDRVTINGPYGEFRRNESEREMICIAGGSGMAPLKSILYDMKEKGMTERKVRYFFGARSKRDLFLVDEMKALEHDLPNFKFFPVLSDKAPEDDWTGEEGLVTEAVDRHVPDVTEAEAYLCGSPLMIDACIKVLTANGMPEERIFYDKFA